MANIHTWTSTRLIFSPQCFHTADTSLFFHVDIIQSGFLVARPSCTNWSPALAFHGSPLDSAFKFHQATDNEPDCRQFIYVRWCEESPFIIRAAKADNVVKAMIGWSSRHLRTLKCSGSSTLTSGRNFSITCCETTNVAGGSVYNCIKTVCALHQ